MKPTRDFESCWLFYECLTVSKELRERESFYLLFMIRGLFDSDSFIYSYIKCLHKAFFVSWKKSEVTQLCLTLCDPMDCSLPGSSIPGILQAGILEWVAISFSKRSSQPSDQTQVSHIAGRSFTIWTTFSWSAHICAYLRNKALIAGYLELCFYENLYSKQPWRIKTGLGH